MDKSVIAIPEDRAAMIGNIMRLEEAILAHPDRVAGFPLSHYFVPGVYMRSMTVPKGGLLTGKIHKTEHLCILAQGEVSVWTDDGMKRLKAPSVVHSMPGIKRAIYAHEDSTWINVHHNPTDEKDLDKIEEIYTVKTFAEFLEQSERAILAEKGD